eukprot:CAMPEP_0198236782 /NCGR_PEP_ID=MMETSP1446-20131203/2675_1 /TAXON_ID=1461542 ORGANISM="Unidentified sp, Strain CCMP2111" /NCGR_SAMPLE_ID=MMETSP1446 /ASSEMBLY_ACC=CAM_ASM_001112 /LENGTH=611 /DNA_ID=CAMNT_0043918717 /DNA_START=1 /DNA_END=1836 /DNA_ORIENTATION=-
MGCLSTRGNKWAAARTVQGGLARRGEVNHCSAQGKMQTQLQMRLQMRGNTNTNTEGGGSALLAGCRSYSNRCLLRGDRGMRCCGPARASRGSFAGSQGVFGLGAHLSPSSRSSSTSVASGSPSSSASTSTSASPSPSSPSQSRAGDGSKPSADSFWRASVDFKYVRDNVEEVAAMCSHRNVTRADPHLVADLYGRYLARVQELTDLQQDRNANARKLKAKAKGGPASAPVPPVDRSALVQEGKDIKARIATMEAKVLELEAALQREGREIPNRMHPDVPLGGEECSRVVQTVGAPRDFGFPVRDHLELGRRLDLVDFEAAGEVSGSKFYYLRNEAALLELALVSYGMSKAVARGFTPVATPDLVRTEVLEKCGFQPRASNTQTYSVEGTDLCLAGTAEVPLAGSQMDRVIAAGDLPVKMAGFGRCFRTEAGAAGRKGKGLYRVHQFSKVEMFAVCAPEESDAMLQEMLEVEVDMFRELGLHFRVMDMASGDLGAPAYRKFDIEAWMPGMGKYGEISSASNCTDFQARRLNVRYRPSSSSSEQQATAGNSSKKKKKVKTEFAHTLNATVCAIPRMIIAILENFQEADGSVLIPDVLQPFMFGQQRIGPPPPQ